MTKALLPLRPKSSAPRLVDTSDIAGLLTSSSAPSKPCLKVFGGYSVLTAISVGLAADLESACLKVNAACPGFTKIHLEYFRGPVTVDEAAREPV